MEPSGTKRTFWTPSPVQPFLVLSPIAELANREVEVEASVRVSLLMNTDFWFWVANIVILLETPTIAFKGRWSGLVFLVE